MSLNINQIDEYMTALVTNARGLIRESELLFKKKAYARSYTLSHIAREELAKCQILYGAGRRLIAGIDVDWKQTMKRLRDHKSKLNQETINNAALCFIGGNEQVYNDAMQSVKASSDLRNDYKNNSLYVGVSTDGNILCPNNVIDQARAQRNLELARFALTEEVNFQSKVGKISKMDPNKLPDISKVDSMTNVEYKAVLEQFADTFRNTSKK
ncbi:AbiV family abortive infection protein [Vibrio parahaemolyticus]|uniref:AbiV family abortive infection protein n=1 Tax=Vibrio parahaemolyticus TaxID=670 RepID=UPI00046FFA24|nr:AbiV family abortive infection protein [Vibrio parahaemolyticus]MDF5406043.1 AbiV family abortive infection protein [Vibrio parahaemolyticus]MDG2821540.1 AbiV family abortive infection protein [Vibrio parahaemolyticus]MDG2844685.1 AbiV family abortive infection protein [Vibrio parahaemolyticus]MDG2856833.1 AbiV family abortive infection protein [Vibrio parahaemolyticus]MDG2865548.1 AbiV family abortive infection protein [Vibrio parahaemolyticus]